MLILFIFINYFDGVESKSKKKIFIFLVIIFYKFYNMDIFLFYFYNYNFYCNFEIMCRYKEYNYLCDYRCKY